MIPNRLFKILESKLGMLVIGFVLTTMLGTYISERFQQKNWEETQNAEFLRRKLDKQEALINDVSKLISNRAFRLERLEWALEDHVNHRKKLDDKERERLMGLWDDYYSKVIAWNENYKMHYIKLKYLAGDTVASMFYVSELEARGEEPTTVYGKFVQAHNAMLDLRYAVLEGRDQQQEKYQLVERRISTLNAGVDDFLLELYTSLDENARRLVDGRKARR
jgi:hypothetical protein